MNYIRAKLFYYVLVVLGVLMLFLRAEFSGAAGWAMVVLAFLFWIAAALVSYRYVRCPHCGQSLLRTDRSGVCPKCGKRL